MERQKSSTGVSASRRWNLTDADKKAARLKIKKLLGLAASCRKDLAVVKLASGGRSVLVRTTKGGKIMRTFLEENFPEENLHYASHNPDWAAKYYD